MAAYWDEMMSIIRPSVSHSQTKHDSTNVGRVEIIVVLLPVKITNQSSSIPQTTTYTTIINLSHCHSDSCHTFIYKYFNALKQFRRALLHKEELTNRLSGSTAMTVFSRPFFCFFFLRRWCSDLLRLWPKYCAPTDVNTT